MENEEKQNLWYVLLAHAKAYPKIEPTDAVKLLYQNEFGGGHMIADPEKSLKRLEEEMKTVIPCATAPLFEEIGNGMVRVMLSALPKDYPLSRLNEDFVRSANAHKGKTERFLEKIEVLREAVSAGRFSFSLETLDGYLLRYREAGYPAVSHSQAYRDAYRPAYRVVRLDLVSYAPKKP